MLNLFFTLFAAIAPMQTAAPITTQPSAVVNGNWRTEIVGKSVYIYYRNTLVCVVPLPIP